MWITRPLYTADGWPWGEPIGLEFTGDFELNLSLRLFDVFSEQPVSSLSQVMEFNDM